MPKSKPQFWFRSTLFKVAPDEDAKTNPFCYGQELAEWIRNRFLDLGYEVGKVIPEDWGWCVMLQRRPFLLWIGCGNVDSESFEIDLPEQKETFVPDGSLLTWTCFVVAEVFPWHRDFWARLFGKSKADQSVQKVSTELEGVLHAEEAIQMVDAP
jgi:hypothetical protein